jgi:RND family efflux transporter MFP subunit
MADEIQPENDVRHEGARPAAEESPVTPTPTESARRGWRAAGRRRPAVAAYVVIAFLALGAGIGGTLLTLRYMPGAQAGAAPPAATVTSGEQHAGHGGAPQPEATAAGDQTASGESKGVYISPARQQLIGVRTAEVVHQALDTTIRTVGVIAYDETRVAEIHTKIAGWAERVSVDFVGKQVRKGQPLFTIYSPDLVATQREYLLALKADRQLSNSQIPETREGARSLLDATRERLRLWDVTDAQVEELARSGETRRTLTVYSPFTGIVFERNAFPGQYITPEMATFKIADLSTLWVIGQVFEYELGMLKLGQPVDIEFPYGQTTRRLRGRITFIYPDVDAQTRRAKVRIEFRNPGLEFKPESFVTVLIESSGGHQLAVPQEAVIDTGAEQYALLALADGYFEPRPIKVGPPVNQFYPVLEGLQHGDRVVTSAQFLIDSETNLQAAMQSMVGHGHATGGGGEPTGQPPATQAPAPAGLDIAFSSRPDPPRAGENSFEVTVKDAQGQSVTDATVEVSFFMPAMPSMGMPAMRSRAALPHAGGGTYRGTGEISAGRWDVTVTVRRGGQRLGTKATAVVVR